MATSDSETLGGRSTIWIVDQSTSVADAGRRDSRDENGLQRIVTIVLARMIGPECQRMHAKIVRTADRLSSQTGAKFRSDSSRGIRAALDQELPDSEALEEQLHSKIRAKNFRRASPLAERC